jgi:hypothetical protein
MAAVRLLQGKEFKDGVVENNIVKIKQNLVIKNATLDEWLEKTRDMKDTESIDSLMSDAQVDALFK